MKARVGKAALPIFISLLVTMTSACAQAEARAAFDVYVREGTSFWARTRAEWLTGATEGWFLPVSSVGEGDLRYPGYADSPSVSLIGLPVSEMILSCASGRVGRVTLSLYNRGDAGEIAESKFQAIAATAEQGIAAWLGKRGQVRPSARPTPGVIAGTKVWSVPPTAVALRWSASKHAVIGGASAVDEGVKGFRAEYIEVQLQPVAGPGGAPPALSRAAPAGLGASGYMIKRNVRREPDGSVFVDNIPMVDQGDRGYCAVATSERLLRYYGRDVDQHMLAQRANTGTGGGTSPEEMLDVLRKGGLAFGTKTTVHEAFGVREFLALIDEYNAMARGVGQPEIALGQSRVLDIGAIYGAMDPQILRRTRCERQASAMRKFFKDITTCVDQGIPLAWGVILGLVEEEVPIPQAQGGHLRIIFGYNAETRSILYTDSWGAGHERKFMRLTDAWTITTALYSLDPRR